MIIVILSHHVLGRFLTQKWVTNTYALLIDTYICNKNRECMAVRAISGELLLLGIEKGDGTGEESKVSFRGIGDILV